MLTGHQSWVFERKPVIRSSASVVGPFEGRGPLARDFDIIHGDSMLEEKSWEKAEKVLLDSNNIDSVGADPVDRRMMLYLWDRTG